MRFLLAGFLWALFVSNICAGDTATSPASGASDTDEQRPPVFQLTIRPSLAEKHSIQTTGGGRDAIGNPVKYNRTETGFTLPELISSIYSEKGPHLLIESPLPEGRFDILINSTSGSRLQIGSLQALRRTAIEAAFCLTAEHETHNLEAFALTVKDKEANGLRTTRGPTNSGEAAGVGYLSGTNCKIDALVKRLEPLLKQPVIDETALIGNFDYHLEWGPKAATDEPTNARLINAVRDQLGLDLKLTKRPVDVLVIRRIGTAQRAQENSDAR